MTAQPHRFVVPVRGVTTFCTFRDGELVPENPLPAVAFQHHALDSEFGWVAWADDSGKRIGRVHLDAGEGEGGFALLAMPEGYAAGCLLFHRQVLFVGGNCGKEILGSFDFAAPEPKWTPLDVPEQFQRYGKRIDDLLLDGDWLIAVDDIVSPKYLLRYDVADPRAPVLRNVREIPYHSSYETIHSAALGTDWIALFSSTMNHGWHGIHIAFLDRKLLQEYGAITATVSGSYRGDEPKRAWRHVAFHGNTLLVAAGADGVGILDLNSLRRPRQPVAQRDHGWHRTEETRRFSEVCRDNLLYRPFGATVVRTVPVPGTRFFLVVTERDGVLDTVVGELP